MCLRNAVQGTFLCKDHKLIRMTVEGKGLAVALCLKRLDDEARGTVGPTGEAGGIPEDGVTEL